MKKAIENIVKVLNNVSSMVLLFIVAVAIGNFGHNIYSPKSEVVPVIENTLIKVEQQVNVPVKSDSLPLENDGRVVIEIVDDRRIVYVSYEDLEYISKKRSRIKKLVKNLDALFHRLEE